MNRGETQQWREHRVAFVSVRDFAACGLKTENLETFGLLGGANAAGVC
jgi:hypothetical protein